MPARKDDKYTDPELREEVKDEIQADDKGGAPGQWPAGKAQMMASEYKKRGGGYTTDKKDKDETAKHLDQWTEEDKKEKEETDEKKQKDSKEGNQHVSNTLKAKEARKNKSDYKSAKNCTEHWEEEQHLEKNMQEYKEFQEQNRQSAKNAGGKASKHGHEADGSSPNKKQKKNSDVPDAPAGSKTRLPKKGQKVQWHSIGGYIEGEVVEVVYEEKTCLGKDCFNGLSVR
ncbi:hypothetical protein GQ44DRAFT_734620 [Phaeosphaeriaceae sp. PMI808]|nr:hypothetical protein GQ44DRAFT_734620 [Phaeosphaeriaceae sp. PMI808]